MKTKITLKLLFLFIVSKLSYNFLAYQGLFSFPDLLNQFKLPKFILAFANFDGIHYIKIATLGYYQYSQAFFPLYPLLINILKNVFLRNSFFAGFIISNASFLTGLIFLEKILKKRREEKRFFWTILFLLTFPTSFFFHTLYSEGLFFMLFLMAIYFLQEKKYLAAAIVSALASSTRLVGIFLFIPFILTLYPHLKRRRTLFVFFPLLGLLFYMFYLWKTTGDPFAFINAQPAFGAGRSTRIVFLPQVYFRYLKIFFMSRIDFGYFVALLEFFTFSFVFIISIIESIRSFKRKDFFYLSIALFSLINIVLPTLTGTFLSTPRFALLSLSTFFFLANLKSAYLKICLLVLFAVLQTILFAFFVQGYFIS